MKTTSLELSKQLKEAGLPQESYFWWDISRMGTENINRHEENWNSDNWMGESYAAPTADEILDLLPTAIYIQKTKHKWEYWLQIERLSHGWMIRYDRLEKSLYPVVDASFTEALAKIWLSLKKEGLL